MRYGSPNPRSVSMTAPVRSVDDEHDAVAIAADPGGVAVGRDRDALRLTRDRNDVAARRRRQRQHRDRRCRRCCRSTIRSPFADTPSMCDARPFVGSASDDGAAFGNRRSARPCSLRDVTTTSVSPGRNAMPCGRWYSLQSIVRATACALDVDHRDACCPACRARRSSTRAPIARRATPRLRAVPRPSAASRARARSRRRSSSRCCRSCC